jgi:metal-responsive CopG/Arc/MetJ family transcriptional regulator
VVDVSYQKLVNVSFKIETDLLAEIDVLAKEKGTIRSEIIRRALRWYIKSYLRPTVTPRMTIYDANSSRFR